MPENSAGSTDRCLRVDTRFATFLAEEYSRLENKLEAEADTLAECNVEYYDREWDNSRNYKWRKVDPDDHKDKRVYKAFAYKDAEGRPRRRVKTQPYPSGETTTFNDRAIINDEYETWCADRKAEAGHLTDAERAHLETRRAERRTREAKEQAERAERQRVRAEQQRLEAEREAARKAETLEAALKAWPHLPPATTHPYLSRKKLEGHPWHDVRQNGTELWIALRNVATSEITGIQRITADGKKLMVSGSHKVGAAMFVTGVPTDQVMHIAMSEGFADTGACAFALKDGQDERHVVAAVDAGNLRAVYAALKARYPAAEIVIASDDDAGTALKTDDKGKLRENTGQVKAHTLALEVSCKVAVPSLPGQTGVNVDFSDVHVQLGPKEVARQLAAAGYAKAEFAKTDFDNKSFERSYELAKTYECSVTVCRGRYLALPELLPGITVLRALMGVGKTEAVKRWHAEHPELSVLAVSHLRGLVADIAARLGLTDYRDIPTGYEQTRAHTAYCVNSLWRLTLSGQVQPVDVLFLDEIAQLLRRLTSRKDFENKRQCLAVLEYLVRSAKYVVVADAHVDSTVMQWLKRLRPNDAPHMVLSTHRPGTGRTVYRHTRKGNVRAQARNALIAGKRVYYATNGLKRAKEVERWVKSLKSELPDLKVLLVCSETAAEEPVQAFFKDPNKEGKKYDLIVASPSVSTGISIDNGHFNVVCGEFSARVGTPNDALQALARVRGCTEIHVWVEKRRANLVTNRDLIRSAFWEDAGVDTVMSDIDPLTGITTVADGYAKLYLDVKSAEHHAINFYTAGFWQLVDEDGYTVCDGHAAADAAEIEVQARDAAKEAGVQALIEADDLSDREATALRVAKTNRTLTQAENYALERYDLKQFYRLDPETPDDELRAIIQADRDGDLRREVRRLELAAKSPEEIDAKMREQAEHGILAPDVTRYDHRHTALIATLKAAGINPETLEATGAGYDADMLRETWIKPLEAWWETYRVSVGAGWSELSYAQSQPIRALGEVLRGAFGLSHRRGGKNAAGIYTVNAELLETRRVLIAKRQDTEKADSRGQVISISRNNIVTPVPAPSVPTQNPPRKPVDREPEPAEWVPVSDYKATTNA